MNTADRIRAYHTAKYNTYRRRRSGTKEGNHGYLQVYTLRS